MGNIVGIRAKNLSLKKKFRPLGTVLGIRDTALTGYLIDTLNSQHFSLSENVENKLYKAAEDFEKTKSGTHLLREAKANRFLSLKMQFRPVDSILGIRDTALAGYLIKTLGDENISLPRAIEEAFYKAAENFESTESGIHFLNEVIVGHPTLRK